MALSISIATTLMTKIQIGQSRRSESFPGLDDEEPDPPDADDEPDEDDEFISMSSPDPDDEELPVAEEPELTPKLTTLMH